MLAMPRLCVKVPPALQRCGQTGLTDPGSDVFHAVKLNTSDADCVNDVIAAHRPGHVLPYPPTQEDLPDEPRGSESAQEPPAGLDVRTLAHQLPRGAPPLPHAV